MSLYVADHAPMTPFITQSLTLEPLVDEVVAAPVAGLSPRGLQKRRLQGQDHPPFVRVGNRRVKYALTMVRAWRDARTVSAPIPSSPCATTNLNNMTNSTETTFSAAQRDSAIATLDNNATVLNAVRTLMLARQHQQQEESGRAVMAEAFVATVAAGLEPTPEAVAATLVGLTERANCAAARARASTQQVRAAVGRHQEAMKPVRAAIESALSNLRTQRAGAMHKRDTRTDADANGTTQLSADIQRLKDAGYEVKASLAVSALSDDEVRRQNLIVQALGQKVSRLEAFTKQIALDLAGLARVAAEDGHEGILAALASLNAVEEIV